MSIPIERWEACGNTYLLVERERVGRPLVAADAIALCDRVSGLGADGVLELLPGAGPVRLSMVIWNPDGSTTEACGNGTRMAARWASRPRPETVCPSVETLRYATACAMRQTLPCLIHGVKNY